MFELLEGRRLLATIWRNAVDSLDVDRNQFVVPLDALHVINDLNAIGSRALPAIKDPSAFFLDTNGDQFLSPIDALLVINYLNDGAGQQRRLRETGSLASTTEITIGLGQDAGSRTYRVQIDSMFDTTDQTPALEDLLAVYLVDELDPTTTILDRGTPGTALFTLAGADAEYVPGGVRWDGSILEIDLTPFAARTARSSSVPLRTKSELTRSTSSPATARWPPRSPPPIRRRWLCASSTWWPTWRPRWRWRSSR